jgi:hypothetical protein
MTLNSFQTKSLTGGSQAIVSSKLAASSRPPLARPLLASPLLASPLLARMMSANGKQGDEQRMSNLARGHEI